jgi:membrane associated rhomboid family serine protease
MVVFLAVLWLVEIVDVLFLDHELERQGIQPRSWGGLDGILLAPFLHDDFAHLISNTVPLAVLGALVLLHEIPRWFQVTAVVIVVGGLATWLLARSATHIGASGVVFGYLGFLLAAGFFERSLRAVTLGVATGLAYGGLLWGVLPTRPGISWESHLFGLLAGGLAAWWLLPRRVAG